MIIENKERYLISIPFEYFNEDNYLKPQGYRKITNLICDLHLMDTDQKIGSLIQGKYSWVILSLSINVSKPINELKPVYGKTWYSGRRGPFFRREYQIEDEEGNILFVAASYSILMDVEKRTIFRQQEVPFTSFYETLNYVLSAKPSLKINKTETLLLEGIVKNSHIDGIGHVNNLRYPEFVYDSFKEAQLENFKKPFSLELYFQKEMVKNEKYQIYSNNKDLFQVYNLTKSDIAFSLILK